MTPFMIVFVSLANVSTAGAQASSPIELPALRVHSERSPRISESQVCYRRPLEQGRGSVLVCDSRGGK